MQQTRPTLITLCPRHFSPPRGKAYPVTIRHPEMLRRMSAGMTVRLWDGFAWHGRAGESIEDVCSHGGGRCFVEMRPIWLDFPFDCDPGGKGIAHPLTTIWLSLPDDSDPRQRAAPLVMQLDAGETPLAAAAMRPGPLLILGPQRSGTTAMQVALHLATRYRAPTDINRHSGNTLEGFHFAQVTRSLVGHSLLSCFGTDSRQTSLRTGVFDDSGLADMAIDSLAQHVMNVYNTSACSAGCWTDKCPGWEPTVLGPLFVAMFPGARVMFMSRDPVSCALSIARLESSLPNSLDDQGAVLSLARNSAVWTISHLLWRRYGRPRVPHRSRLELSFETFRDQPAEIVPQLVECLGLSGQEGEQFVAALGRVRLPRNPIDREAMDPRIPALILRLCRDEALRWSPQERDAVDLDAAVVEQACRLFRVQVERMLTWHSLRPEVVSAIADRLVDAAAHPGAPLREEPPLPPPGPLLSARIALGAGPETSIQE